MNGVDAERRRGYARWEGERGSGAGAWWVIARGNLSLALANRWVKVVLVASLIPGVILAGVTYFFLPLSATALDFVLDFSAVFTFLLAAIVGARLIADDRRQGAFLAHFARPVTRYAYIAGKFVALFLPLFFVTTASAIFGIAADVAVDSETIAQRIQAEAGEIPDETGFLTQANAWSALGAVLWFGLIMAGSTTGIVLGVSALTTRARIAGVIWFALVGMGAAAHQILRASLRQAWPAFLSWMDGLFDLSSFLLGFTNDPERGRILEYSLGVRVAGLLIPALIGLVVVHEQLRRAEGGAR